MDVSNEQPYGEEVSPSAVGLEPGAAGEPEDVEKCEGLSRKRQEQEARQLLESQEELELTDEFQSVKSPGTSAKRPGSSRGPQVQGAQAQRSQVP